MRTLIFLIAAVSVSAQVAETANSGYKTKEGRAKVAAALDAPDRAKTQKPEAILAAMKVKPGMTVADVGTGTGFMLPYMSRAVGDKGRVFGEDIQTEFLDRAKGRIAQEKLTNVTLVQGTETDPKLPSDMVDALLVLDAYHHFDYPEKVLGSIARSLKKKGELAIVEFYRSEGPSPGHIRLDRDDVAKEISSYGFTLVSKVDRITDRQYLLLCEKK